MSEPRPIFPLVNEETARLKWFEAFMRKRVDLEQQMISGLRELLEGVPPLPQSKLSWHCSLERLLDGTRDELHIRMDKLEKLKGQIQAVGMSIVKAEMCIRDLSVEFAKIESTDSVDFAQAATATAHKDWRDIKSADVSVQKRLSSLLPPGQAQKANLESKKMKANKAFQKYYEQDLIYRRIVYQKRRSQEEFLNEFPHRIQEYGAKYWVTTRDLGIVMESFANYLRDISSTCNSTGSALWASAKDIKPLVDANRHTEAIEFAYRRSPIWFSPIYYQNPGFKSPSPSGQAILFGCPLERCTDGEPTKIPPVLEYLLESVPRYWCPDSDTYPVEDCWPLVNELERGWTGVEKNDRAFISELVIQGHLRPLIMAYFMSLPNPVLSNGDIVLVQDTSYQSASQIWNTWSVDPTKAAVIRAILHCQIRLYYYYFGRVMSVALGQNKEASRIKDLLFILDRHPDTWRSPVSNIREENQYLWTLL